MSFLLDTNICSAYLKGDRRLCNKFTQHGEQLHISAITAAELFTWVLRAKASRKRLIGLTDLLKSAVFLEVNELVSRKFGEVRARQPDQSVPTPELDLLIGATALVHDLTLVTHNTQDFVNVPGLKIVDWLVP